MNFFTSQHTIRVLRHDVFFTSWRVFNVMMHFLTSWCVFDILTFFEVITSLWRHDALFEVMNFSKSWRIVDGITNLFHHSMFLTSWRTFNVMTCFLTSWRTFWHHDELFDVITNFLMSWRVIFMSRQTFWRHDELFSSASRKAAELF